MATEPNALTDAISEALALGKSDLNEACTCQWIIMPLLQAAGYSLYDIQPQQTDPAGKIPDYTILPDSEHTWFLEAKAWGVALNDQHAQQALIYAYTNNRRWVVLTNGREWRLYDNSIPGELSENWWRRRGWRMWTMWRSSWRPSGGSP
jgi:predicted type IV restriction endonuclease